MDNEHIRYEIEDGVGTVTLIRPEKLNALTYDSYRELERLTAEVARNPAVHVLVLRGEGGKAFCAGGDVHEIIGDLVERGTREHLEFTYMTGALVRNLREMPQPVICEVAGVAVGAGAVIALASDFRILGESLADLGAHQIRPPRLVEDVVDPFEKLLGLQVSESQADADPTGDGQQLLLAKLVGQTLVAGQDDGQERPRVELARGKNAQLGQDGRQGLLGFVDEHDRPVAGRLDLGGPGFAEALESGPPVVGCEGDAEEMSELAVEVGQLALGPGEDADDDVGGLVEVVRQLPQGGGLAGARLAGDQRESALTHEAVGAPAEVDQIRGLPECLDGDVGRERVPCQAEGLAKIGTVHQGFSVGM